MISSAKGRLEKKTKLLRGVPNSWCRLINTQVTRCPECTGSWKMCTSWHMKYAHGIEIRNVRKVWREEICKITRLSREEISRERIQEMLSPILEEHLDKFEKAKTEIHNNRQKDTKKEAFRPQKI